MAISSIKAERITFHRNGSMSVALTDGRIITVPLKWFPRLMKAKPKARRAWEICGGGAGIYWPMVDEDLSIEGLLRGIPSVEYRPAPSHKKSTSPQVRV